MPSSGWASRRTTGTVPGQRWAPNPSSTRPPGHMSSANRTPGHPQARPGRRRRSGRIATGRRPPGSSEWPLAAPSHWCLHTNNQILWAPESEDNPDMPADGMLWYQRTQRDIGRGHRPCRTLGLDCSYLGKPFSCFDTTTMVLDRTWPPPPPLQIDMCVHNPTPTRTFP